MIRKPGRRSRRILVALAAVVWILPACEQQGADRASAAKDASEAPAATESGGVSSAPTTTAAVKVFAVEGMHCTGCAHLIQTALEKTPGVVKADVSFGKKEARVVTAASGPSDEAIVKIVAGVGEEYKATRKTE